MSVGAVVGLAFVVLLVVWLLAGRVPHAADAVAAQPSESAPRARGSVAEQPFAADVVIAPPELERREAPQIAPPPRPDERRDDVAGIVVHGRAWTADGEGAEIVVGAFRRASSGLAYAPDAATEVGDDHSFTLELPAAAEYSFVAVSKDYRPRSARVRITAKSPTSPTALQLELERGHTISGRVTPASFELPAMSVVAAPSAALDLIQLRGRRLTWCGDSFEWTERRADVQSDGTFEIAGLGRRDYRVALSGAAAYLSSSADAVTRAPAHGVELSLEQVACEVRLSFIECGRARAGLSFSIAVDRGGGRQSLGSHRSDEHGRAVVWIEPDAAASVIVRGSGQSERTFELRTGGGGEIVERSIEL